MVIEEKSSMASGEYLTTSFRSRGRRRRNLHDRESIRVVLPPSSHSHINKTTAKKISWMLASLNLWNSSSSSSSWLVSSLRLPPKRHSTMFCQHEHRHPIRQFFNSHHSTVIHHRVIGKNIDDGNNEDVTGNNQNIQVPAFKKRRKRGSIESELSKHNSLSKNSARDINQTKLSSSKSTLYKHNTLNHTHSAATMSTAVCIVPPHHAWDVIQRARHLARDASFYRWPPAIRLFHPFVPQKDVSDAAGRLASWMDNIYDAEEQGGVKNNEHASRHDVDVDALVDHINDSSLYLRPFEVTLDSILILPHLEILDARIEALDHTRVGEGRTGRGRSPRGARETERQYPNRGGQQVHPKQQGYVDYDYQDTYDNYYSNDKSEEKNASESQEMEHRRRMAESAKLIEDEERKGIARKKERERKRRMRHIGKEGDRSHEEGDDNFGTAESMTSSSGEDENDNEDEKTVASSSYNGPCVVYLSPDNTSRYRLETLRERLRVELFPNYDAFSPGSSVSPYPEYLPRPRGNSGSSVVGKDSRKDVDDTLTSQPSSQFRPLLPIGRFATVKDAVALAKVLQRTWDPLTFNVTDIQFISRQLTHQDNDYDVIATAPPVGRRISDGDTNTLQEEEGTSWTRTSPSSSSVSRMAISSTSGKVEDAFRQGVYGCDAMVMLWGEEPEEELMEREASLAMMMGDDNKDDDDDGVDSLNDVKIEYNKIFATAEREYWRMQAHEILTAKDVPLITYPGNNERGFDEDDESNTSSDIEAWLNEDDESLEDEGATVVIGRAQYFLGAMREFVGMPASSSIDSKDRNICS